ncbi:TIM barrel protein [Candidatus Poribacteria bacterium]|nr:TIM barrel protein [Candidatus Poribacteria bacterium]
MELHGIGAQLYVWSQVFGKEGKSVEEDLDEALGEVVAGGFDGAEGNLAWAGTADKARRVRQLYDAHGLQIPSLYHGGAYHTVDDASRTIAETLSFARYAADIGCPAVNVNPNPIGRDKTGAELRIQADGLNRLGEGLRALGMSLYIHNHDPEIRNNAHEFRANVRLTDPALVSLCVDTHWVYRGGADPIGLLREVIARTRSLHVRQSQGGTWDETFRDGDIDHREIRRVLEEGEYSGWLLLELAYEQKTVLTRSLAENAKLARGYVREVFGA